jgi:hypothetical protein
LTAFPKETAVTDKPVTVRLPKATIDKLMGLAILDGGNLAAQIRAAVDAYVDARLNDPALETKVADARKRQTDVLASLSATSDRAGQPALVS